MTNTYTWLVESLDCTPSLDDKTNVVSCVHWRFNGTDGTHSATVYSTQPLTYEAGKQFTAYADLTKDTVIKWVQNALGAEQVASIQQNLDNQIANLANPPIVQPSLPWGNI